MSKRMITWDATKNIKVGDVVQANWGGYYQGWSLTTGVVKRIDEKGWLFVNEDGAELCFSPYTIEPMTKITVIRSETL